MKTARRIDPAAPLPATSCAEIERLRTNWPPYFLETYPDEAQAADDEWALVQLGRRPTSLQDRIDLDKARTSLPGMWAAFWRPRSDGRTGIDLALLRPRLGTPAAQAGLRRLAQARGVYVESLDVNPRAKTLTLRDLFTQEIYHVVGVDPALLSGFRRWLRYYGVLVELGDGTWTYVSAFISGQLLHDLSPEAFVRVTQGGLAAAGYDPAEIDPAAPHQGLRRYCGVAFPALLRWLREQPRPPQRPKYAVNSEGDRFELHEGRIRLSAPAARALADALTRAEDFVLSGPGSHEWAPREHRSDFIENESLGSVRAERDGFEVNTNSVRRHEALLERLAQLAGERPEVVRLQVMRPWEKAPGFCAEPGPDTQELALASSFVQAGKDGRAPTLDIVSQMRRSLDRHNRKLGGVPRELVKTEAGRAEVAGWLREAEEQGTPDPDGSRRYLDLDPLRTELGLSTIRDLIVHAGGGRGV